VRNTTPLIKKARRTGRTGRRITEVCTSRERRLTGNIRSVITTPRSVSLRWCGNHTGRCREGNKNFKKAPRKKEKKEAGGIGTDVILKRKSRKREQEERFSEEEELVPSTGQFEDEATHCNIGKEASVTLENKREKYAEERRRRQTCPFIKGRGVTRRGLLSGKNRCRL